MTSALPSQSGYLAFLRDNRIWLSAGFLISFVSSFGQTFFISVFSGEIMHDFGLSDGQWGGLYMVGTAASAMAMIWAGVLTDMFRARLLGTVTMVMLAAGCLALAVMPGSWGWALVVIIFALRFTGQGMMSHIAIVAMARWFAAQRGRALAVVAMGFAAGQAVLPVIFAALMTRFDWRWLWVLATIIVVAAIPVVARLLSRERSPQSIAAESPQAGMGNQHWTRAEALRNPLFWFMVPVMIGPPTWVTALFFQQVHLTGTKGWSMVEFVALMPLFTGLTIAATILSGWAVDRFGTARLVPLFMLPFAGAFMVLGAAQTLTGAALGLSILALGTGMQTTLPGAFWAEHYGTAHIGAIKAAAAAVMVLGSAIGPGISGWLIGRGIDFADQMPWIAAFFVAAGISGTLGLVLARRF